MGKFSSRLPRTLGRKNRDLGNRARGPFLERPGKLTGPVSYFEIEV